MENQELKIRIYHPEEEAFGNSDVRIDCRRICSDHRWAGFRATYVPDSGFGGPQARAEALRKGGKSPKPVCGTHFAHGASVKHPRKLCLRIFISSIFCAPIRRWPFSSPLRWVFWFDPHADPHGETSGWKQWKQEGQRALISEQKVLKTSRNRYFYIFSTLRNQQVAGSSPATSSRNR